MSAKSGYLAAELVKFASGQSNALGTAPTPYLALLSAISAPGEAGTEVSGHSYARVSTATKWAAPTTPSGNKRRVVSNATVAFAAMSADKSVVGIALYDALTAGNLLYSKALGVTITVTSGNPASFAAGDLAIEED